MFDLICCRLCLISENMIRQTAQQQPAVAQFHNQFSKYIHLNKLLSSVKDGYFTDDWCAAAVTWLTTGPSFTCRWDSPCCTFFPPKYVKYNLSSSDKWPSAAGRAMTVFPKEQRRTTFVNSTAKRHREEVRGGALTLTNYISALASLKARYQGCSYDTGSTIKPHFNDQHCLHWKLTDDLYLCYNNCFYSSCSSFRLLLFFTTKLLFRPSFLTLKC